MNEQDEQIRQQCIFCQIIMGKVPSRVVYEDEYSYAILDINPATPGHILLLTKEHYAIMPQIPDHVIGHLGQVTKALSQTLIRALKVEGTTTFIANGIAGGQRAQHFMIHIIPQGPGFSLSIPKKEMRQEDHEKVRDLIAPAIKTVLDYEPSEEKERADQPDEDRKSSQEDNSESEGKPDVSQSDDGRNTQDNKAGSDDDDNGSLDSLTEFLTK